MNNTKNLLYIALCITSTFSFGMHITSQFITKTARPKYSNIINRSDILDKIRQTFKPNNSPQDVITISQGAITIKEEIPLGKRYGTCHNYAFTTLMEITGKAPELLNIVGQREYYASNGINIFDFFDSAPVSHQPGDIIVYHTAEDKHLTSINQIQHTGIVVGDDRIESKWGIIPAVFVHPTWYVPAAFGNTIMYYRPKITGKPLLKAVQQRLAQKSIKEIYNAKSLLAQQTLFHLIIKSEQTCGCQDIYELFEYQMNVHANIPDKDGLTAHMIAEKIGNEIIIKLLSAYDHTNQE